MKKTILEKDEKIIKEIEPLFPNSKNYDWCQECFRIVPREQLRYVTHQKLDQWLLVCDDCREEVCKRCGK